MSHCTHGEVIQPCLDCAREAETPESRALDERLARLCAEVKTPTLRPSRGPETEVARLRARVAELEALIDTPHTDDFMRAVQLEAAHQVKRWGTEHDAGKTPADWFWLVGYLLGKALHFPEKRRHHLISSAAALLNWFRAEVGDSNAMRPGVAPPEEPTCTGLTAFWCPVCGDCTCERSESGDCEFQGDAAVPRCPLHSSASRHASQEDS